MAPLVKPWLEAGSLLREKGLTLAVAESCTGGLLSSLITDVPGSSDYFAGSVVAYSNDIKAALLGVKKSTIEESGAVSKQTATEMALGIKKKLKADLGISITGIAGPGGGTPEKPVGTVYMAVAFKDTVAVKKFLFKGSRKTIKKQSAIAAIEMAVNVLKKGTQKSKGERP